MSSLRQNLRFAIRMLARSPGFTAAAVLCLALGIGATTAIFTVVHAVVIRKLPYRGSERMVRVYTEFPTFPNGGLRRFPVSPPEFLELRRDAQSFELLEAWTVGGVNLAGDTEPVRATASYVSAGMLRALGVAPSRGRLLDENDDRAGAPLNAVISHGLWRRAYGGEASAIGRDARVNGRSAMIVGIMPEGFHFPPGEVDPPELWLPLQIDPAKPGGRGSHFLSLVGRLKPGITPEQASGEMTRYVQHHKGTLPEKAHGFDPGNHTVVLEGFQESVVRRVRPAMLVLLAAVGFVLLIACVNVANLLLARAEARRHEIAIRAAIGAGFGRLLRQFITEGVLLSTAGAALGIAVAYGGLKLLVKTNAGSIPRVSEIAIDATVLVFALLICIGTGVLFGLAPVVHMTGGLVETLKAATGRVAGTAPANRFRRVLVAGELALTLMLLIGAGLMVKAFWKLQEVDAGFEPANVLTMRIALPQATYPAARTTQFWTALEEGVNSLPGVVSAAVAAGLPPDRQLNANDTQIEGFVPTPGGPIQNVDYWNVVGPKYFEAMGIRLIEGRFFDARDGEKATPVVVVNETMARAYWGARSAIGRRIRPGFTDPWRTIVGVVADVKNGGIDRPTGSELYMPVQQFQGANRFLVVKTSGRPAALAASVRAQVRTLDAALPVANVRTMDEVMSAARARPRFLTLLLTLFSSVSLLLAALGIYGVISYAVAQRTTEIGVRMAIGARTYDVLRLVLGEGVRLAFFGAVAGAAGALILTRFLRGLLFGVSEFDVLTFLAMAGVLGAVTLLACYIPARRAARVDPVVALRYE